MTQQIFIPQIKGLNPLFDRRKVQETYVVDGKNFILDADGPKSGLGRELLAYEVVTPRSNIQSFKISETSESFILTNTGIYRFDADSKSLIPVYTFHHLNIPLIIQSEVPWTMAAVGNRYYFARQGSDLIEYDLPTDSWQNLTGAAIPQNPYACTESDGRLVVLSEFFTSWSAIGNGQDFVASTATGAGAQALTKLGLSAPKPLGIVAVQDGFITFLSSGIMKSKSVISTNPYRHTILSKSLRLVNPYCFAVDESDSVIFLTATGLFKTAGAKPEPWQAGMGEYLQESILSQIDILNSQSNVQIHFDTERNWFSVWFSENGTNYAYETALILNVKLDAWGSLNTPFTAFLDFYTFPKAFKGFISGIVDISGSFFRFDSSHGIEYLPDDSRFSFYHFEEERPARVNQGVFIGTTLGKFKVAASTKGATGVYDKYYEVRSLISPANLSTAQRLPTEPLEIVFSTSTTFGVGVTVIAETRITPPTQSLNSYVTIGTFRLTDELESDSFSYIRNIGVGTLESFSGTVTFTDWASETQFPVETFVDWATIEGTEDWGLLDSINSVNYNLECICTLDGYTPITNFTPEVSPINEESTSDFYSCNSSGIYHLLKFTAFELNQNYHVKTLDIGINLGGRL